MPTSDFRTNCEQSRLCMNTLEADRQEVMTQCHAAAACIRNTILNSDVIPVPSDASIMTNLGNGCPITAQRQALEALVTATIKGGQNA